ncbi:hypothetical protein ARNL5_02407 [Anaerolineae bacterium]|nr:hypothetical protein ARNL5_02407 [Anaerolineae bacterium]
MRDWKDLVHAQAALVRAHRDMRSRPTGEMVRDEPDRPDPPVLDRIEDARRVALAVNRAAAFGIFRPKCLVRSMALRRLLNAAGIEGAHVRVGVYLAHGQFIAHAWVEYAGQVVGDDPAFVARYVPMTGLQVAELE